MIVKLVASSFVVIAVSTVLSILVIRSYVREQIDNRLMVTSERIRVGLLGLPGLRIDAATTERMAQPESAAVAVEDDGQIVLVANTDTETATAMQLAALDDGRPHEVASRPGLLAIRLDIAAAGATFIRHDGTPVAADALIIGFDTSGVAAAQHRLVLIAAAGVLLLAGVITALTVLIVGRSLRPIRAMSERAHALAAGDRSVRLPVPTDDADLERLALTVNEALEVQQQSETRLRAFVADASHELRTPLTTATGWIELYLQGGLDDPNRRDLAMQRAMAQLARMRTLIDELALLARLDRARPLDLDPVDLTALTAEVVEDARVINTDRRFSLHAPGPATVLGDAPKLQQVVQNLLGNAVQHTPAGTSVEVTVRPARPDAAVGSAMHTLLVTDHGPGISKQDQEHVFTRFWRGDTSRNRHTGGVGLGLAIVSSIVTAHGGTSDVISQVGHGTTIRVRLPASRSAREAEPVAGTR
jgi:two-component system OmpR family sensor kinase